MGDVHTHKPFCSSLTAFGSNITFESDAALQVTTDPLTGNVTARSMAPIHYFRNGEPVTVFGSCAVFADNQTINYYVGEAVVVLGVRAFDGTYDRVTKSLERLVLKHFGLDPNVKHVIDSNHCRYMSGGLNTANGEVIYCDKDTLLVKGIKGCDDAQFTIDGKVYPFTDVILCGKIE